MKNRFSAAALCLLVLLVACRKPSLQPSPVTNVLPSAYKEFVIPKGEHYATGNVLKPVETTGVTFLVRFDSSAVYQTAAPENQYDINKLYGFSDNGDHHHRFSARFGWRWSDGALRLFAYTYNNGLRDAKELGIVPIGQDVRCGIKALGEEVGS